MDEQHQANTGEFETLFCSFCIKKIVLLQSAACTEEKHALDELEPTPPPERQGKKGLVTSDQGTGVVSLLFGSSKV